MGTARPRHQTDTASAYWIAFGPHGPRALPPPGESTKVFAYTAIGMSVGVVIYFATHHFAGGPPPTMTKEWQEATNKYMKVRVTKRSTVIALMLCAYILDVCRRTRSSLSLVSQAKATQDQAWCKASLPRRTHSNRLQNLILRRLQLLRNWTMGNHRV